MNGRWPGFGPYGGYSEYVSVPLSYLIKADGLFKLQPEVAPVNAIGVSNSNTPGVVDPTNPDGQNFYRGIAEINGVGQVTVISSNSYSGDNGRAGIWGGSR